MCIISNTRHKVSKMDFSSSCGTGSSYNRDMKLLRAPIDLGDEDDIQENKLRYKIKTVGFIFQFSYKFYNLMLNSVS